MTLMLQVVDAVTLKDLEMTIQMVFFAIFITILLLFVFIKVIGIIVCWGFADWYVKVKRLE